MSCELGLFLHGANVLVRSCGEEIHVKSIHITRFSMASLFTVLFIEIYTCLDELTMLPWLDASMRCRNLVSQAAVEFRGVQLVLSHRRHLKLLIGSVKEPRDEVQNHKM